MTDPFEGYEARRDLALASIDGLALLSYVVDACSTVGAVGAPELCRVAVDLGLMVERVKLEGEDVVDAALPGDAICAFSDALNNDLALGRKRLVERYRSDKH